MDEQTIPPELRNKKHFGISDIATILDKHRTTISRWLERGYIPVPDSDPPCGRKQWNAIRFVQWAKKEGWL